MANDAILGLQQLNSGKLDDRLLSGSLRPVQEKADDIGLAAAEAIVQVCSDRLPPPGRPQLDAALERLQGARGAGSPFPRSSASSYDDALRKLQEEKNIALLP
eukprot:5145181-Heterocapsa_arctica.AAC.1